MNTGVLVSTHTTLLCIVQDPLPKEQCRSQWAEPSHTKYESRQLCIDIFTGQPDSDNLIEPFFPSESML